MRLRLVSASPISMPASHSSAKYGNSRIGRESDADECVRSLEVKDLARVLFGACWLAGWLVDLPSGRLLVVLVIYCR